MIDISKVEKEFFKKQTIAFAGIFLISLIVAATLYIADFLLINLNQWTIFVGLSVAILFTYLVVISLLILYIGAERAYYRLCNSLDVQTNIKEYLKNSPEKTGLFIGSILTLCSLFFLAQAYLFWPMGTITFRVMSTESTIPFGLLPAIAGVLGIYMGVSMFWKIYSLYQEN